MDKRILECMDRLVHIHREAKAVVRLGNQVGIYICDPFTSNGIQVGDIKDMAAASGAEIHTQEWRGETDLYMHSIAYDGVTFFELNEKEKL